MECCSLNYYPKKRKELEPVIKVIEDVRKEGVGVDDFLMCVIFSN